MTDTSETTWTTRCRSCGENVTLPRRNPAYGTSLVCPACKTPVQVPCEDRPGCPVGWTPKQVEVFFGYQGISLENPQCPWCGKVAYDVVFPERGREVAWYVNRQQENPKANYVIQVGCPSCGRTFCVEWDGWPFRLDSQMRCNFCMAIGFERTVFMTIPEDRRADFERDLGRNASTLSYLSGGDGRPLWVACSRCLTAALRSHEDEHGTDLAQAYSLGAELDQYVDELLAIDKADGLIGGSTEAYNTEGRHRRGREIGEMLLAKGGLALMERVAENFVNRRGMEGNLSWCWNRIEDSSGHVVWYA